MMLLQRENEHVGSSGYAPIGAGEAVNSKQSGLAMWVGAYQDVGIRHKYRPNEDTVLVIHSAMPSASIPLKPFVLVAVADGMGGQEHGQEASQLAARTLVEYMSGPLCSEQRSPEDLLSLLKAGVQYANRVVFERNQEQQTVMGTTMTVALVSETTAYIAHVGDSRLYLYREARLRQITYDHSVVAALVEAGSIAPEDIYIHPWRNQIYRSLGSEGTVEVDTFTVPLTAGDILLLCSDGLWEMVRDKEIAAIVSTPMVGPTDTAHALIQAALEGGGDDNVSAIVVQVSNM
jgi:serine/threonine protein phosphatase PrpC